MLNFIPSVPVFIEWVILLAAFVAALYALKKTVYDPVKKFNTKVNRGMDTLLGYGAVLDPASGREIQAATPPLANRVYQLEQANSQIADALTTLAATSKAVVDLQSQWEDREKAAADVINAWTDWREHHEQEADARETRLAEWEAWRQEQNLLMEGIKHAHDL